MADLLDVIDRPNDIQKKNELMIWLELGLRTIAVMYDEHSSDKRSKENIYLLKDSIFYRLQAIIHMYKLLLNEISNQEQALINKEYSIYRQPGIFPESSAFAMIMEPRITAIFDSLIFNMVSFVDYLSHFICYILKKQKTETLYWVKLMKSVRDKNNELAKFESSSVIDACDKEIFSKLYDYRSDLIHNKRVPHTYQVDELIKDRLYKIKIFVSTSEKKIFKNILDVKPGYQVTIHYLASALLNHTAKCVFKILSTLTTDIKNDTNLYQNLHGAKGPNRLMFLYMNENTGMGEPVSEAFWRDFLSQASNHIEP